MAFNKLARVLLYTYVVGAGAVKFVSVLNQDVLVIGGFMLTVPVEYGPVNMRVLRVH